MFLVILFLCFLDKLFFIFSFAISTSRLELELRFELEVISTVSGGLEGIEIEDFSKLKSGGGGGGGGVENVCISSSRSEMSG